MKSNPTTLNMRRDVKQMTLDATINISMEVIVLYHIGLPKGWILIFLIFSLFNHIQFINILVFNYKEVDDIEHNGFGKSVIISIMKKFCSYETSEEGEKRTFHFRVFSKKLDIDVPIESGVK